jgi:hypothetical protein
MGIKLVANLLVLKTQAKHQEDNENYHNQQLSLRHKYRNILLVLLSRSPSTLPALQENVSAVTKIRLLGDTSSSSAGIYSLPGGRTKGKG